MNPRLHRECVDSTQTSKSGKFKVDIVAVLIGNTGSRVSPSFIWGSPLSLFADLLAKPPLMCNIVTYSAHIAATDFIICVMLLPFVVC